MKWLSMFGIELYLRLWLPRKTMTLRRQVHIKKNNYNYTKSNYLSQQWVDRAKSIEVRKLKGRETLFTVFVIFRVPRQSVRLNNMENMVPTFLPWSQECLRLLTNPRRREGSKLKTAPQIWVLILLKWGVFTAVDFFMWWIWSNIGHIVPYVWKS